MLPQISTQQIYRAINWEYRMVELSRITDRKKFEKIDYDKFITVKFIKEQDSRQSGKCYHCNKFYNRLRLKEDFNNNPSIERLDNLKPHYKSNCVIACIKCNCSRKDKTLTDYKDYLKNKQLKTK